MSHQSHSKEPLTAQIREEKSVGTLPRIGRASWFSVLLARPLAGTQSRLVSVIITLALWAHAAAVFAQGRGQPPAAAPAEKSYVLPYVIVVLCIALGLLVVCRSGGRSNEPKVENLE